MAITLQGWSFNNDGSPAPNLVVTCYDQTPNQVGLTSTNSAGFWQFTGLTAGITYDVKITNNGVVKWIKGGEAHQASSLNLTSSLTASGTWDFTSANLILPTQAAVVTQGRIGLTAAGGSVWFGDGTVSRTLATLEQTQTFTGAKTFSAATGNPLTVNGNAGNWTAVVSSANTGVQDGLLVTAGSGSGDYTAYFQNRASTAVPFLVRGDGLVQVGNSAQISVGPGTTAPTIASPTLSGTTTATTLNVTTTNSSGTITTAAINSADWFRLSAANVGIYNSITNTGIQFTSGGQLLYPSGDQITGNTSTQTLTNKTLVNHKESGPSGFVLTTNDLTNYSFNYGTGTFTLPNPSATYTGVFRAIKAWGGGVTVNCGVVAMIAPGISGSVVSSFTLNAGDSATMWCDGTNWWAL